MVSSVAFVSWVVNSSRRCSSQRSLSDCSPGVKPAFVLCFSFIRASFLRRRFAFISFLRLPAVQQNEFLDPLARVHFSRIQIALGIRRDLMEPVKLPRVAAVVPRLAHYGAILSPQGPDDVVL